MRRIKKLSIFVAVGLVMMGGVGVGLVWALGWNRVSSWAAPALAAVVDDPWSPLGLEQPPYLLTDADRRALETAKARIAARAQTPRRVRLVGADGQALPSGEELEYRLLKHHFGLGTFDQASPQVNRVWSPWQNKCYVLVTWNSVYRPTRDAFDFRAAEVYWPAEWWRAVGMQVTWHNVVWVIDKTRNGVSTELRVPEHVRGLSMAEQQEEILAWTRRAAAYTEGRYDIVNVYNEPLNHWTDPYKWGKAERLAFLKRVVETFRAHNTTSQIQISIGEALTARQGRMADELLAWLAAEGVPVDRVALQLWSNGQFKPGIAMPRLTLARMHERLERLAGHGFVLDITEFQVPRAGHPHPFWAWTPQRQADWAETVATLAFGTPGVHSFGYFRTRDDFMRHGGVFEGNQVMPAVERLNDLYAGWHARGTAQTGPDGELAWTGFAGTYVIRHADASAGQDQQWVVCFDLEQQDGGTVIAEPVPELAPESIRGLGPMVTADHYLPVEIASAEAIPTRSTPAWDAMDGVLPLRWRRFTDEPRGMTRTDAGIELGGDWQSGFSLDKVPDGAERLVAVLEVPDRGVKLAFNVFDRCRRYAEPALAPGRYRVVIPVEQGSRPALHLFARMGEREPYEAEPEDLPYAILEQAWFE